MNAINPNPFLRRVLLADAAASGAVAIAQVAAAPMLASLLALPVPLLQGTGAFLIGYVILLVVVSRAPAVWTPLMAIIIIGNVAWGVGCIAVSQIIAPSPSMLGDAYLIFQALVVWAFAALEWRGLRTSQASHRLAAA
jgi:hypothetical protein